MKANGKKPYRPEPRTALLKFEGTDYDGLEIRVRLSVPLRVLLELSKLGQTNDLDAQEHALTMFGDRVLLEWNLLGEDGEPLPANAQGFLECPSDLANTIAQAWIQAVSEPPAPLSGPSGATGTSLERSMPMGSL